MASNVLWNSLLATPTLLGAALIVSASALAADVPTAEVDALLSDTTSDTASDLNSVLSASDLAPLEISSTLC
jgi:hypothetical protein